MGAAPTPTMDEVTFKSDTVLSDVHLYTPNQRHLMVRLNSMGQPGKVLPGVCGGAWHPVDPSVFSDSFWGKSLGRLDELLTSHRSVLSCLEETALLRTCWVPGRSEWAELWLESNRETGPSIPSAPDPSPALSLPC